MKIKILLALDSSEYSLKAADYVANLLGKNPDVSIRLFHVLHNIPPSYLEYGTIDQKRELDSAKTKWEESEHSVDCKCTEPVIETMKEAGFRDDQIKEKHFAPTQGEDVAQAILDECAKGGYDTLVMGKRGKSAHKTFLKGSVTEKVVRYAKGIAVWVIE